MSWGELVTTALLGTTRRPLAEAVPDWTPVTRPTTDQAVRLLDLAAAHRALVAVGQEPEVAPPGQVGPEQRRPVAPVAAVRLLDELLSSPDPTVLSRWLETCVAYGRTVAPVHWTAIARLASRSTQYDRAVVGRALGERGRWFLRQNPDWRRLAADAFAGAATPPPPPASPPPASPPPQPASFSPGADGSHARIAADTLAADPELIFARPDPWPAELVAAAWAVIGSGVLGAKSRTYAAGVGIRLPAELYPRIGAAAEFFLLTPDASPALRRLVRDAFVALERTAYVRAEITAAFAGTAIDLDRVEIPHV